jgi:hypothetical protein
VKSTGASFEFLAWTLAIPFFIFFFRPCSKDFGIKLHGITSQKIVISTFTANKPQILYQSRQHCAVVILM